MCQKWSENDGTVAVVLGWLDPGGSHVGCVHILSDRLRINGIRYNFVGTCMESVHE